MKAVYKRELTSYFNSMIGYVFIAFLVAVMGIYFMAVNLYSGYPNFAYTLYNTLFIFLVAIPILTMRSMAEDRRSKTDQLLYTSPSGVTGIVLGKYFAMLTVFAVPTLIFCLCPLILRVSGSTMTVSDYNAILVFFLLGAVYIAVGQFISSLTESQIIAVVGTFGALMLFQLWSGIVSYLPTSALGSLVGILLLLGVLCGVLCFYTSNGFLSGVLCGVGALAAVVVYLVKSSLFAGLLPGVLEKFDLTGVFYNVVNYSIFDLKGILLYLSLIFLFVFLTVQTVQRRRWN